MVSGRYLMVGPFGCVGLCLQTRHTMRLMVRHHKGPYQVLEMESNLSFGIHMIPIYVHTDIYTHSPARARK